MASAVACPGCGALIADVEGPVHRYVPSAPGCWRIFGEAQALAAGFDRAPAHRLMVDAYMAQHPGDGSERRERQSVFVHLLSLCAVLERGRSAQQANDLLRRALRRHDEFPVLRRAGGPGELTVLHVRSAADAGELAARADAWAAAVWASWSAQHELIGVALDAL